MHCGGCPRANQNTIPMQQTPRSSIANLRHALLCTTAAALLLGLFSCAAEPKRNGAAAPDAEVGSVDAGRNPQRLLLGGVSTTDSLAVVGDFHVDQVLRQVLDSVPQVEYITVNRRDSIALAGDGSGVELRRLFEELALDGVVYVELARFGSILGAQFRIVDAAGSAVHRDLVFQMIRYRDSTGAMLAGPALYDAMRSALGRYLQKPHGDGWRVAQTAIVPLAVVIPKELGRIGTERSRISYATLRALAEFANRHVAEFTAVDPSSRDELYASAGAGVVENYVAPNDLDRGVLYRVGIDRYLVGSATAAGDSIRLQLQLHRLRSRVSDVVVDSASVAFPRIYFESTTVERDFVVAMIDLAEQIYARESERIREEYQTGLR